MAYDEALAARMRGLLEGETGITERVMFGGLAFLADGRMAVAVSGRDVVMVRADPETEDRLLGQDDVEQTVMGGRPMRGWLDLGPALVSDDARLRDVVAHAVSHARTLPPR